MIYNIGLIFVILIILVSMDDLVWDIYYLFSRLSGKSKISTIDADEIEKTIPKMLAIIVAAYNEENVLKSVITNLIISNQYPRSMYHIFLGVYPNDEGTMKIARELEGDFDNVHMIIHTLPGPSSKADNINNVIKNIFEFENNHHMRFEGFVIHDSEDLVHPYEFQVENYLLQYHSAIQMPVFPLQEKPSFSNLFKNMVSGTYADEFAENHYSMLLARTSTGSFVPSAGTGFVLSRNLIDKFNDYNVFPVGSLTEDYKLSLQIKQMGFDVYYVLEKLSRLRLDGTVANEFISTRSMFPNNYKQAVRQKTRWIYGITMQSFQLKDILKTNSLNFISKYSLYKDWKAKFGNLLLGPGYVIFIYFVLSLFFNIPTMYPKYTTSWYLVVFLSIMMIQRQFLRARAVKNVYGKTSAFISCLLPPLLPFRMILGNIINFHATVNAFKMNIFKGTSNKSKKKPKWSKTDHEFLEEEILKRFRRNLGDTLLHKGLISSKNLDTALKTSIKNNEKLGNTLINLGFVLEEDVVKSVCETTQKDYIDLKPEMVSSHYIDKLGIDNLENLKVVPLLITSKEIILVTTIDSDETYIKETLGKENLSFIYSTENKIMECLHSGTREKDVLDRIKSIETFIDEDLINLEQGLIALSFTTTGATIESVLFDMGLLREDRHFSYT